MNKRKRIRWWCNHQKFCDWNTPLTLKGNSDKYDDQKYVKLLYFDKVIEKLGQHTFLSGLAFNDDLWK